MVNRENNPSSSGASFVAKFGFVVLVAAAIYITILFLLYRSVWGDAASFAEQLALGDAARNLVHVVLAGITIVGLGASLRFVISPRSIWHCAPLALAPLVAPMVLNALFGANVSIVGGKPLRWCNFNPETLGIDGYFDISAKDRGAPPYFDPRTNRPLVSCADAEREKERLTMERAQAKAEADEAARLAALRRAEEEAARKDELNNALAESNQRQEALTKQLEAAEQSRREAEEAAKLAMRAAEEERQRRHYEPVREPPIETSGNASKSPSSIATALQTPYVRIDVVERRFLAGRWEIELSVNNLHPNPIRVADGAADGAGSRFLSADALRIGAGAFESVRIKISGDTRVLSIPFAVLAANPRDGAGRGNTFLESGVAIIDLRKQP